MVLEGTTILADFVILAGFDPIAVLCVVVDDDGSMARLSQLKEFVKRDNLKIISIVDLIRDPNLHFVESPVLAPPEVQIIRAMVKLFTPRRTFTYMLEYTFEITDAISSIQGQLENPNAKSGHVPC
nr:bifunctional riboflavin biosynthesis protein RIBA 1, chloroplastic-like [Tanacetum cinerariifolium]